MVELSCCCGPLGFSVYDQMRFDTVDRVDFLRPHVLLHVLSRAPDPVCTLLAEHWQQSVGKPSGVKVNAQSQVKLFQLEMDQQKMTNMMLVQTDGTSSQSEDVLTIQ